jgi:hypothetical protein
MRRWMFAIGLALWATTGIVGKESVSITVSPAVSFAPAHLVIRTSVEPNENNRAMEVVADSELFYRSSTIPLEGDRAPKTTIVQFASVPSGTYQVTASLIGADGQRRALARTHVDVIQSGR